MAAMNEGNPPQSSMILYLTEDGRTRIQCRFENETLWLTQALIAELFQIGVNTVNHHLKEIYEDSELPREATIRQYRIVRLEGTREVAREIEQITSMSCWSAFATSGPASAGCICASGKFWREPPTILPQRLKRRSSKRCRTNCISPPPAKPLPN